MDNEERVEWARKKREGRDVVELTLPTTTVATRQTEEAGPLRMRTSAKGFVKVRKERRV